MKTSGTFRDTKLRTGNTSIKINHKIQVQVGDKLGWVVCLRVDQVYACIVYVIQGKIVKNMSMIFC